MNTPNPLIPQGALPGKNPGKTNFRIAVFTILAIHAVLLIGLLMQGCKPKKEETAAAPKTNDFDFPPLTNSVVYYTSNPVPPPDTNLAAAPTNYGLPPLTHLEPAFEPPPSDRPLTPEVPAPAMTEHVIVRNDIFGKLAKRYGVSVRAIQEANPDADPRRLKIGQKIQVPVPAAAPAVPGLETESAALATYVVKPGDTLSRIARGHGTTVKSLRAANQLATDLIKVGQKLKIPPKMAGAAANGGARSNVPPLSIQ